MSTRSAQHEVKLVVLRLLSVLMSRTRSGPASKAAAAAEVRTMICKQREEGDVKAQDGDICLIS